jgi:N,N'-diacetyllegionaminate synthase
VAAAAGGKVVKTLVIAEAGVNHNGDLALARQLVEAAAEAGADIVKFQTFQPDRLVTRSAAKAAYQHRATDGDETQLDMLRRLQLDRAAHEELIAHCMRNHIAFLSTAFDAESVDLLVELGVDLFKIPSGELTNLPYLRQIGSYNRPVILSSGMATLDEIEAALEALQQAGTPRDRVTVLHCTTEYPAPMHEVNLRAMLTIGSELGVAVGYSDHTRGIEVPIAAVALGAVVIEKHFTLDRQLPGPDHAASLEVDELAAMIRGIRNVEAALGDGVKRVAESEALNRKLVRKSLVAAVAIRAGELLTAENVAAKRPGTGISPMLWDDVMGRTAPRAFAPDEMIEL